jgi:hypothetical protein
VSDLLDLCTSNATGQVGPYAEVRVGEHVTRYVRRGTGPSIVLVGTDANTNPVVLPLITKLAPNHRLIVPQTPSADDLAGWLRGFIEGIGLADIAVVMSGVPAAAASELAATDDFTIRKLVVLPPSSPRASSNGKHSSDRILWVDAAWTADDAVARIASFIADEVAA